MEQFTKAPGAKNKDTDSAFRLGLTVLTPKVNGVIIRLTAMAFSITLMGISLMENGQKTKLTVMAPTTT